jgi:membrane-associated protease RseP (regulator of RpoE activity)
MTSVTPEPGSLAVTPSRRGWRITAYVVVLLILLAVIGWVSTHPDALPTTDKTVRAETPVGEPVYVGVFGAPADFDRSLHVAGVHVFATSTADVTIVPHVCHKGSVNVTTTPETFCAELGPTEDATLEGGDAIVLEIVGDVPSVVEIDRVRIAYRDGLQWATQDAGARSQVSILAR